MKDRMHEDAIVQQVERIKLGSLLQSIAREAGGADRRRSGVVRPTPRQDTGRNDEI